MSNTKVRSKSTQERDNLGDQDVDGRLLKLILREECESMGWIERTQDTYSPVLISFVINIMKSKFGRDTCYMLSVASVVLYLLVPTYELHRT
jgi:hypothetical protein